MLYIDINLSSQRVGLCQHWYQSFISKYTESLLRCHLVHLQSNVTHKLIFFWLASLGWYCSHIFQALLVLPSIKCLSNALAVLRRILNHSAVASELEPKAQTISIDHRNVQIMPYTSGLYLLNFFFQAHFFIPN